MFQAMAALKQDEFVEMLNSVWPVSYTHLDVYKRQVTDSTISHFSF